MPIEPVQVEVHLDEALDATQRSLLETKLEAEGGVISACFQENNEHRLMVLYDQQDFSHLTLLDAIRERGFHAHIP